MSRDFENLTLIAEGALFWNYHDRAGPNEFEFGTAAYLEKVLAVGITSTGTIGVDMEGEHRACKKTAAVDALFPGASGAFNGVAYLDYWVADPWAKGSYSFYKAGQVTCFPALNLCRKETSTSPANIRRFATLTR